MSGFGRRRDHQHPVQAGIRDVERVQPAGALGEVTLVTSRAFMNRLVAIDNYRRTDDRSSISSMVIAGTHALDIVLWMMEGKISFADGSVDH